MIISRPLRSLPLIVLLLIYQQTQASNWSEVEEKIVALNNAESIANKPGFIISISRGSEALLTISSGAADIEHQRLINRNTVFHIASLSKQITGAALAKAIVNNKVSLDDTVADWLPDAKKYGPDLKVKHLVYMTSGLTEYTEVPRADQKPWATFHYFSIEDAVRSSLSASELLFEPGAQWQYSNINYMLIALIVAKAYKQPFSTVVKEQIFEPLGMNSTIVNDDITQIIPNRANAYLERSERVLSELNRGAKIYAGNSAGLVMIRRNSPHYGGSGVMTSIDDWSKWQAEMLSQEKFGQQFWQIMLSTMKFKHNKVNDAFGLVHRHYKGQSALWYDGGDIDSSAYSISFSNLNLSISCFSNNPMDSCRVRVEKIIDLLQNNNWQSLK